MGGRQLARALRVMILVLLLGSAIAGVRIRVAKGWTGTATIDRDGSVSPPDAPIQRNGENYTLTEDIFVDGNDATYAIRAERSNITLDGNGYSIQGTGAERGIVLTLGTEVIRHVEIRNMTIRSMEIGIALPEDSAESKVVDNNISDCLFGMLLHSPMNNVLNNRVSGCRSGISLDLAPYNQIIGNDVIRNFGGIYLQSTFNSSVVANNITESYTYGLYIDGAYEPNSDHNIISENNISSNGHGYGDSGGIALRYSANHNSIVGNNIVANNGPGIYPFQVPGNNFIYHNNLVNNTEQADTRWADAGSIWTDGYPSGGNFWSDYDGTDVYHGHFQNETGSDGIGDSPYVMDTNNTDHYPLMKPFPWDSHDVGVTYIGRAYTPGFIIFPCVFPPKPFAGLLLHLDFFVMNYGDYSEDLNLTLYANDTVIGNIIDLGLPAKNSTILDVPWNPSDFPHGNYAITAVLEPVPGEKSLADNTFVGGLVYVGIPGDINGDGKISMIDIGSIARNFMRSPDDSCWNPSCDLNDDGKIDTYDIGYSARHFGERI